MEFWARHVAAAGREGIPASEYAKRHGLAVKSLYYWRRKLQSAVEVEVPAQSSKFVSLHLAPGSVHQSHCALELPSGLRLEMSALPQPEWLAAVVCAMLGRH